ncbi:DUF6233 domain-containing protein [Streptomyces sp. MMG1533]|uniref:DUF6233 domain-containing protein n=1 Tax=Streptomyces sp. MMG1533 TaxID=1415546 RepID=UPI000A8AEC5F|nr:DUF6233 domain-containing protein [Streptomyces sp. MMG1533]
MFDDLPADLERLLTLRVWHAMWLERIDAKIAAARKREAEAEHGRRSRPTPPEWVVELGIGTGRPPVQIHAGDCHMAGARRRPVDRTEARRLITAGLRACTHCRPDVQLHILDLAPADAGLRQPGAATLQAAPATAPRSPGASRAAHHTPSWSARTPRPPTGSRNDARHRGTPIEHQYRSGRMLRSR